MTCWLQRFGIAFALLGFVSVLPSTVGAQPPPYVGQWGSFGSGDRQFNSPRGLASDAAGNIYVADTYNHRVQKFSATGVFLGKWGSSGTGDGQFNRPCGIATDAAGNVYVADEGNNRIQKFTGTGTFLFAWGTYGGGDGQFYVPFGVAVDADGNVFVADRANSRIQKFDSLGVFQTKWGVFGTGDGEFNNPRGVVTDAAGDVYVADQSSHRMQKFTGTGTYILQWGAFGVGDGQFGFPFGMAVDAANDVYVADRNNNRIQKFTDTGTYLLQWGSLGTGTDQFHAPEGVAIGPSGIIYVVDSTNNRIMLFGQPPPSFELAWGSYGSGDGQFIRPTAMVADTSGNLYVLDVGTSCIQKFSPDGDFLWKAGSRGSGDGQIYYGAANNYNSAKSNTAGIMAVDSTGTVYLCDTGNNRIQIFSSDGVFLDTWGTPGIADGQFNEPAGLVIVDKHVGGAIYVCDAGNNRIQKFSKEGVFQASWGSCGYGPGEFNGPCGLVISDRHVGGALSLYVLDKGNHRVQEFTEDGTFVTEWGTQGIGPGQFSEPRAIFSAGDDIRCPLCPPMICVLDTGNNVIQKFSGDGVFLTQMGGYGSGSGLLNVCGDPIPGVDVSLEQVPGSICVTDGGNGAIHMFSVDGPELTQWGSRGSGPGEFNGPCSLVISDRHVGGAIAYYVLDAGNCRIQKFSQPTSTTAVGDQPPPVAAPRRMQLSAWPNPGMSQTISFTLTRASNVSLGVFDVNGRLVRTLRSGLAQAGPYNERWDGRTNAGSPVGQGVYFVRLRVDGEAQATSIIHLQ